MANEYTERASDLIEAMGQLASFDPVYDDLMSTMSGLRSELDGLPEVLATAKAAKKDLADKVALRAAMVVNQIDFKAKGASNKEARDTVSKLEIDADPVYTGLAIQLAAAEREYDTLVETADSLRRQLTACASQARLHAAYIQAVSAITMSLQVSPVADDANEPEFDF